MVAIFEWFKHRVSRSKYPKSLIHRADQPDIVVNFFNADGLAWKHGAEIDFLLAKRDAAAVRKRKRAAALKRHKSRAIACAARIFRVKL